MFGIFASVVGAIGGLVAGACSVVGGIIGGVFGGGFMGIVTSILLNQSLSLIFRKLFSTESDEEIRDMGDRVIQGTEQGIKMEDYETFEEYEAALRGVKLDSERSKSIKQEEKEVAGMAFNMKKLELEYDFGIDGISEILNHHPEVAENGNLKEIIDAIKEEDFSEADVEDYYKGKLSVEDTNRFSKILEKFL